MSTGPSLRPGHCRELGPSEARNLPRGVMFDGQFMTKGGLLRGGGFQGEGFPNIPYCSLIMTISVVVSNNILGIFTPIPGEMIQFDEHIFQMGGSTTN